MLKYIYIIQKFSGLEKITIGIAKEKESTRIDNNLVVLLYQYLSKLESFLSLVLNAINMIFGIVLEITEI